MEHTVRPWSHPECYLGATWEGWYSAGFGRSRDSDVLEESNFETVWEELKVLANPDGITDGDETEVTDIRIVREGHWAVGWVEWIAIHGSNTVALDAARELCKRANDYPVLDENDWSNREWNRANEYWESESVNGRLRWLKDYAPEVPCFAARHDLSTILHNYDRYTDRLYSALSEC